MSLDDERLDLTLHKDMYRKPTAELVMPRSISQDGFTASRGPAKDKQIYQVIGLLGAGAMGEVHLVRDALLRREIAYKQLLANAGASEEDQQRFVSEVKITAQLDHPYIVPIYSLEITDRGPAYTMKRVAGDDLKGWIKDLKEAGPQARKKHENRLGLLLEIFLKVCDAMAFAHHKGIIHRDLKPANIMVGPYHEVYIMDWGIARPFGEAGHDYLFEPQEKGKVIGTPRYMSPEQVRGANSQLDGRSDLFALGLILFEILTLQKAYSAESTQALFEKVRYAQVSDFSPLHGTSIARELRAIVKKATAMKRADRYQSVQEMADDLRRYLNGEAVLAEPDNTLQALVRQFKKHRFMAMVVLLGFILASSVLTTWNLYQRQQAMKQAQAQEVKRLGLYSSVVKQGQAVDVKLLGVQRSLHILAGHTIQALEHGTPNTEPYYIEKYDDFYARIPNPFYSSHYHAKLSLDWPGFANAYSIPDAELKPQMQLLNAMHGIHSQILLRSETGGQPYTGDWKHLIAEKGVPLMFTNIVTKEGAYQYYPGIQYQTPDYDPRKRPFYLQGLGQRGIHCGNTYLDRISGQLMPCTLAIYDSQEEFIGVVAVDMQFNHLAKKYLDISGQPALKEIYLLDQQGNIIVKASDKNTKIVKQDKIHTGYELKKFADPELLKVIQNNQKVGILENDQRLLIYNQLNFQNWYYVAEADPKTLYKNPQSKDTKHE